jgi:hypothetical protein
VNDRLPVGHQPDTGPLLDDHLDDGPLIDDPPDTGPLIDDHLDDGLFVRFAMILKRWFLC